MFGKAAVGLLMLGAIAASPVLVSSNDPVADGALRSVSLFDLPEGVSESAFVDAVRGLNEAVRTTGHLDAGYALFKVTQGPMESVSSIDRDFVLIGHWSSQAVYDEIHKSAAYVEAGVKYGQILNAIEHRQYSRYEALSVGGPGEH
ncbi:MAG: hypothetical protein ACYC6F_12640 [Longimicrobiales bacterium]